MNSDYFKPDELKGLDPSLCEMLESARSASRCPFVITCGVRDAAKNAALPNAVQDSAHLTGHAVDLACVDSTMRFAMIRGLLAAGFTRIGVYSRHVHADNDPTKPSNVIWYVEGA